MAERAGLAQQMPGVAAGADGRDLVAPRPLHHERAGAQLIAGGPRHRLRLAGQDRFAEPEIYRASGFSVRDNLIARLHPVSATRVPRNKASRQSSNTSMTAPKLARIKLKTVRTLARVMLA
jgi:hypothetical protein